MRSVLASSAGLTAAALLTWGTLLAGVAGPVGAAFPGENGRIVFVSDQTTGPGVVNPEGDDEIFTVDPDGKNPTQVTFNGLNEFDPAFSPDGGQIAFTRDLEAAPRAFEPDVFKINADGTGEVRLTEAWGFDAQPAWSPNGEKIAFSSERFGGEYTYGIGVMDSADGANQAEIISMGGSSEEPAWSPDGRFIAFTSDARDPDREDIWKVGVDGSGLTRLTEAYDQPDQSPTWSPNGERIAFDSVRKGDDGFEIYSMRADGSRERKLTDSRNASAGDPAWSPDCKKIAYVRSVRLRPRVFASEVYKMKPDGSDKTGVIDDPYPVFSGLDWHPAP